MTGANFTLCDISRFTVATIVTDWSDSRWRCHPHLSPFTNLESHARNRLRQ